MKVKTLKIAKQYLKEKGYIFISKDVNNVYWFRKNIKVDEDKYQAVILIGNRNKCFIPVDDSFSNVRELKPLEKALFILESDFTELMGVIKNAE